MTDPWTPGPWEAGRFTAGEEVIYVVDGKPDDDPDLPIGPQIADNIRTEADARLIAAAPEMADELIEASGIVNDPSLTDREFEQAAISLMRRMDALLARVRGES